MAIKTAKGINTAQPQSQEPLGMTFHPGELTAQDRVGLPASRRALAAKMIRPFMPEQHRRFFSQLPFVVVGATDNKGRPWASVLSGQPGFIQSPDPTHLVLNTALPSGDALENRLIPGASLALLGIELHTRRRNRMNGTVLDAGSGETVVRVDQSFGNCPQYITPRQPAYVGTTQPTVSATESKEMNDDVRAWIQSADTAFVASGTAPEDSQNSESVKYGMDVSHRGGAAGFIHVVNEHQLVLPDYAGNQFFNTIGNLIVNPGIGLLFIDFDTGSLLQLTGYASVVWDTGEIAQYPNAQRLVRIDVDAVVQLSGVLPLRWKPITG